MSFCGLHPQDIAVHGTRVFVDAVEIISYVVTEH